MAEKRFGDRTFRCEPLPALDAFELHLRLGRVVGPALPHVLMAAKGYAETAGLKAISDVLVSVNTKEAKELVKDILETAEVDDGNGYADVIAGQTFERDLELFLEVLLWALECQFAPFGRAVLKSSLWQALAGTEELSSESAQT